MSDTESAEQDQGATREQTPPAPMSPEREQSERAAPPVQFRDITKRMPRNPRARELADRPWTQIRAAIESGLMTRDVSAMFNTPETAIRKRAERERWVTPAKVSRLRKAHIAAQQQAAQESAERARSGAAALQGLGKGQNRSQNGLIETAIEKVQGMSNDPKSCNLHDFNQMPVSLRVGEPLDALDVAVLSSIQLGDALRGSTLRTAVMGMQQAEKLVAEKKLLVTSWEDVGRISTFGGKAAGWDKPDSSNVQVQVLFDAATLAEAHSSTGPVIDMEASGEAQDEYS